MVRVALKTMRCVPVLMMAVLLLGAVPALAQRVAPLSDACRQTGGRRLQSRQPKQRPSPRTPKAAAADSGRRPTAGRRSLPRPSRRGQSRCAQAAEAERPSLPKPSPPKQSRPRRKPPPKPTSAPDAFAGIPPAERLKIQAALLWSGDYTGTVNGEDPMLTAIKNFQKRNKAKVTGELTPAERADLVAAAREHEQEFGWSVVVDPATGIRIGLPVKMVPHAREAARGTRWSSAHGEVQVETFRIADPNLKLSALFEQEKKEPATPQGRIQRAARRQFLHQRPAGAEEIFACAPTSATARCAASPCCTTRRWKTIVAPVMVAMASAFSPFPERSAPFAALAKSVEYGNGLVVSAQGHIVTDRKLTEGCQVMVASGLGDAERIADDKDNGLALLRVYGPRKLSPLALSVDAPQSRAT